MHGNGLIQSERLRALVAAGIALSSERSLDDLLRQLVESAAALTGARSAALAVIGGGGHELERFITHGIDADEVRKIGNLPRGGILGVLIQDAKTLRAPDLAEDSRSVRFAPDHAQKRNLLGVPVMLCGIEYGNLYLAEKDGGADFDSEDEELVGLLVAQAAVASDALRRVVEARELERRRFARELHDQTGQELISVLLGLRAVEEAADPKARARALKAVREQVVETLYGVRRLAVELRPKALDDFGLVPALHRLTQTFVDQTGLRLDIEAQLGEERLPSEIETALYRIVQEALTNISKHAAARSASIVLGRARGAITAVIEDDGRGFDAGAASDGMGLIGMRERLALIGGKLKIETRCGVGTTLVAVVPRR